MVLKEMGSNPHPSIVTNLIALADDDGNGTPLPHEAFAWRAVLPHSLTLLGPGLMLLDCTEF